MPTTAPKPRPGKTATIRRENGIIQVGTVEHEDEIPRTHIVIGPTDAGTQLAYGFAGYLPGHRPFSSHGRARTGCLKTIPFDILKSHPYLNGTDIAITVESIDDNEHTRNELAFAHSSFKFFITRANTPDSLHTLALRKYHQEKKIRSARIATDGSYLRGAHRGGVAAVWDDGSWVAAPYPGATSPHDCEIRAIALALTHSRHYDNVLVESDSRVALSALERILNGEHPSIDTPDTGHLRSVVEQSNLDIEHAWVRGHSDHTLNDTADRIARLIARGSKYRLDSQNLKQQANNIATAINHKPQGKLLSDAKQDT